MTLNNLQKADQNVARDVAEKALKTVPAGKAAELEGVATGVLKMEETRVVRGCLVCLVGA